MALSAGFCKYMPAGINNTIIMIEPGEIARVISCCRDECMSCEESPDLPKMIRFFSEQVLALGYADLN